MRKTNMLLKEMLIANQFIVLMQLKVLEIDLSKYNEKGT